MSSAPTSAGWVGQGRAQKRSIAAASAASSSLIGVSASANGTSSSYEQKFERQYRLLRKQASPSLASERCTAVITTRPSSWTVVLLTLLVAGCAQTSTAARPTPAHSPTEQARPARLDSPTPPSPTPSTSPPAAVTFSCALPVTITGQQSIAGGFISFPAGTITPDPGGTFTTEQTNGNYRLLSTKLPRLIGVPGQTFFYDRAYKRWIPAPRAAVYPDGSRYAYVIGGSSQTVHIVDVATGAEQVFAAPHPINGAVFDYSPNGVYLAGQGEASETGVWLVNPQTGSERLLTDAKIVVAVNGGTAWLSASPTGAFLPDTLVQMNLGNGAKTLWFTRPGQSVMFDGLTADGLPVVSVAGSTTVTYLLRSPSARDEITSGPNGFSNVSSDSHGVWMNAFDGLYLFVPGKGFQMVAQGLLASSGSCA